MKFLRKIQKNAIRVLDMVWKGGKGVGRGVGGLGDAIFNTVSQFC